MSFALALQSATGLVVAAALASIVAIPIDVSPIAPADRGEAGSSGEPHIAEAPPSLNPIALREVFARPLFTEDRRVHVPPLPPAPVPPVRKATPSARVPDLSLLGVAMLRGRSIALLRNEDAGAAEWVRVGDRVGGLEIRTITSRAVTLVHTKREITLELWSRSDVR